MVKIAQWTFLVIGVAIAALGLRKAGRLIEAETLHARVEVIGFSMAIFALALSAFAISRALAARGGSAESIPSRTPGNTVGLAGFSFLALLYGFISFSTVSSSIATLWSPATSDFAEALSSGEGRQVVLVGFVTGAAVLLVGSLIVFSSGLRRWGWRGLTDQDLGREYVYMFVLTFVFPGLLLRLFVGPTHAAGNTADSLSLNDVTYEVSMTTEHGVPAALWVVLGLKAFIHLKRTHRGDTRDRSPTGTLDTLGEDSRATPTFPE